MKRKSIKLLSLLSVVTLLAVSLQSYVASAEDPDDPNKHEAQAIGCAIQCWYWDPINQYWYYVVKEGTQVVCFIGETTCESTPCRVECD